MRKSRFPAKTGSPARIQGKSPNSPSSLRGARELRGAAPAERPADKDPQAEEECPRDIPECRPEWAAPAEDLAAPAALAEDLAAPEALEDRAEAPLPRRLPQERLKTR